MNKNIVYILTRFPMVPETFVYNEILGLIRKNYNIFAVFPLLNEHEDVDENLDSINTIYPPSKYILGKLCISEIFTHSLKVLKIIYYSWKIHKGEYLSIKEGKTSFLKSLFILPQILWIDKTLGASETHFHAFFATMATTAAMILAHIRNSSYSFTGRGSDLLRYGSSNLNIRINDAVFFYTPSNYNKKYIINEFKDIDGDKINVIPSGVNNSQFKPADSVRKQSDRIIFLTVARFSPEKGIDIFLKAFSKFSRDYGEVEYHLIGDGITRNELELMVDRFGMGDQVKFIGIQSPEYISRALQKSHLFVLTSYSEGFPNVLMEAWATGLPILATNITAIPDIVSHEDNGLLVRPGDIEDTYKSLYRLAENNWELLKQLSISARSKNLYKYDRELSLNKVANLMDQI